MLGPCARELRTNMDDQQINHWPTHTFRAMGSHIQLWLDTDEPTARMAFRSAQAIFENVESALSRFDPASELGQLNAKPDQWIAVSPLLWIVLERALALAGETGGLFDPAILPALERAGYTRDFASVKVASLKRGGEIASVKAAPPSASRWGDVQTDADRQRVYLPRGVKIDLGGIAKGWTAERAALALSHYGACLVDAGGDLVAGDEPDGEPGWPIALSAPSADAEATPVDLLMVWLRRGSVATSGIDYRRWEHGGKPAHHVIDPRTGQPARTDLVTATIIAADATQAEAWATTALIMGKDKALAELSRRGIAAALVDAGSGITMTAALEPYLAWRQAA